MTYHEVVSGLISGKVKKFSNIPEEHLNAWVAKTWVQYGRGSLVDIPAHLVDDEVRMAAMTVDSPVNPNYEFIVPSFKTIDPSQTSIYEELALEGIRQDRWVLACVNPALITKDFVLKALDKNAEVLALYSLWSLKSHFGHLICQEIVDHALSKSAIYLEKFELHWFTEKAISICIQNNDFNYQTLVDLGHYHVLVEMIREGFWPAYHRPAPKSPEDAVERWMQEQECLLSRAAVLKYPMEEIIAHMATPERRPALLCLYTVDELMPHLKTKVLGQDQVFKGILMESEMGL